VAKLGWKPFIDAAIDSTSAIMDSALSPIARAVGDNLYLWLSQRMKGKALQIFSITKDNNGWEALRCMYAEYRPTANAAGHMQIVTIITPKWWLEPPRVWRPFYDVLADWEKVIADYELATAETISNALKCATCESTQSHTCSTTADVICKRCATRLQ